MVYSRDDVCLPNDCPQADEWQLSHLRQDDADDMSLKEYLDATHVHDPMSDPSPTMGSNPTTRMDDANPMTKTGASSTTNRDPNRSMSSSMMGPNYSNTMDFHISMSMTMTGPMYSNTMDRCR